jgi:hypothetical protein
MQSPLLDNRPDLLRYQGYWTNAAHNIALQAWSELGITGLFLLLAMFALAFQHLLRGARWCPAPEFPMRLALAGMLAACAAQGQMNFTIEHPAGALTFFLLLAAIIIEHDTRRPSFNLPPLVLDKGWVRIRLDFRSMKEPTGVGLIFKTSPRAAGVAVALAVGGAAAAATLAQRHILAQNQYALARAIEPRLAAAPPEQRAALARDLEAHLQRALRLDPWATGCRSFYSAWLIDQRRAQEGLDQLRRVRERLNSPELWEREARALTMLGRADEARRAHQLFLERVWSERQRRAP